MFSLTFNKRIIVTGVLEIALLALLTYGFFLVKKTEAEVDARTAQIRTEESRLLATTHARKVLQASGGARDTLKAFFVPVDGVVAFIESIENLASESGAEITVHSVDVAPFEQEGYEVIDMTFRILGASSDVFHALRLVEERPLALSVITARLSSVGTREADGAPLSEAIVSIRVLKRIE